MAISYANAVENILAIASTRRIATETVPLVLANSRILAEECVAGEDVPSAANSAMDGYAVRSADTAAASPEHPLRLAITGESAAGMRPPLPTLLPGSAVRIMTGALLPQGADSVIEVEATHEDDGIVEIRRSIAPGTSVRRAGEDIRSGETVLPEGRRLTPADIGILASIGITNVPVTVRPLVGILATGDELVAAHKTPGIGELRNSTLPALYAAIAAAGAEPIDLGIARDNPEQLAERIEEGLRYDILITTGGVSAGRYDHVQHILPKLGVAIAFHGVAIRPGRPLMMGTYGTPPNHTMVFALPGNPVSTLITFDRFVLPAIRELLGEQRVPMLVKARLESAIQKRDRNFHFVRGFLTSNSGGDISVRTTGTQSSGVLSSMSRANSLILLDESTCSLDVGAIVDVELL